MKRKPEVMKRRAQPIRKIAQMIRSVEQNGGMFLTCGCFVGINAYDLRILIQQAGSESVLDITECIEAAHEHN